MKSEPTYPCKRMRRFRATFGDLAACSACHSWADYTISMFEFEFLTATGGSNSWPHSLQCMGDVDAFIVVLLLQPSTGDGFGFGHIGG